MSRTRPRPNRVVLGVEVEDAPPAAPALAAVRAWIAFVNVSVEQRNFMGRGQEVRAEVNYSGYSKSMSLGFTEPYLFDHNRRRLRPLPARPQQLQFLRDDAHHHLSAEHDRRPDPHGRAADPADAARIALRPQLRSGHPRHDALLYRSRRRGAAAAPAIPCSRPISLRQNRQPHDLFGRLFAR